MSDTSHSTAADGGPDDLPRTLRRARDERNREAHAAAMAATQSGPTPPRFEPGRRASFDAPLDEGVVTAVKIPFFRLMLFFIKAVFAAIPAMILLGVIVWFAMKGLKLYYPELIQLEVLIRAPK